MKILAIYRHYWPDAAPYARILKCILEEQARQGHEVTILTAQPSYNDIKFERRANLEHVEGVEVIRCPLFPERKHWHVVRAINSVLFLTWAVCQSFRRCSYDVVIANSHPPVVMGLALQVIKFLTRVPYILHCQDIHPESAALAEQVKSQWLIKVLRRLDTASCLRATLVITLSEDMKQTLVRRCSKLTDRIAVLNNFGLDTQSNSPAIARKDSSFQLIFAGNMGRFQGLDRLVEAVGLLGSELPVELMFLGTGSETKHLQELSEKLCASQIRFVGYQSPQVAMEWVQKADLGVVSLAEGVCQVAYPSKTMAYATAGCPILSIVERDSQIARDVKRLDLGYVPEEVSPCGIADAIRVAWRDRDRWTADAKAALSKRAECEFGSAKALIEWNRIFASLESGKVGQAIKAVHRQAA
jgi:colanic acid biosynthesis glycosyl transferase WcaI